MARTLPAPCLRCGYPIVPFDPDAGTLAHCDRCPPDAPPPPDRRFFLADVLDGFLSVFRGTAELPRPEFRKTLALAIAVNFVLVIALFFALVFALQYGIAQVPWGGIWGWVETAASFLAWPLALIASWFLAPAVINLGMSPFFDAFANGAERLEGGDRMKSVEIGLRRSFLAALNGTIQILALQICLLIPALILSLIPIIGLAFVVLAAMISAYLNALVWFEIPVLRRSYGWRYRRQVVSLNSPRALGFGLGFNLGLMIPFYNIFAIGPSATIAVSRQFFRCDKRAPVVRTALEDAGFAATGSSRANSV